MRGMVSMPVVCHRHRNHCGVNGDLAEYQWPEVRRVGSPRSTLFPDTADGAHGSTRWIVEATRLGRLRPSTGGSSHTTSIQYKESFQFVAQ